MQVHCPKIPKIKFHQVLIRMTSPYYLRGSKVIKKEIELIESRNDEDILLM